MHGTMNIKFGIIIIIIIIIIVYFIFVNNILIKNKFRLS